MARSTQQGRHTADTPKKPERPRKAKRSADASLDELRRRLEEAEEVIRAIRGGEVDAVVVAGAHGDQVYTLKDAARSYQAVIDQMSEGALTLNEEGVILYANQRAAELFQVRLENVLGEPLSEFVVPSDKDAALDLIRRGVARQAKGELTLATGKSNLATGDRGTLPVLISMKRIVLEEEPRVSTIIADISARKRAEEQLRMYAAALEQRVAERTAQLQRSLEQERSVRTALEVTNKELEAFTYTVSHDFRGPVNQVNELARVLLEDYGTILPESGVELARLIHSHSGALNCLAEDLLALTRVSQQAVERKPMDMSNVVHEVLVDLEPQRAMRHVEIKVGDLTPAVADPVLLKQVWYNLISNAFKFTRKKPAARIEIGSWKPEDGDWKAEVTRWLTGRGYARPVHASPSDWSSANFRYPIYYVRDNGAGFDAAQAARLFRAFQRLHHSDDFEGSGLGLAIVERAVRRHSGRVGAEGEIDHGSVFWFTLG